MTELDLSGEGKASDAEIEAASENILIELRIFDSPKDAGSTIALAHYKMLVAAFPSEFKKEAFAALDAHCEMIKKFLEEDWN